MKKIKAINLAMPVSAIILGVIASMLLIALTGVSPLSVLETLLKDGFGLSGKVAPLFMTLGTSTPLMLTGLAAMLGFKVGVFSIAQEGQYVMGAIIAAWLGASLNLPSPIAVPMIMILSMAVAALYGLIPALLKVKLGVNEIISSIMMNNIAAYVLEYLVAFPMRADAGQKAQSAVINRDYWLYQFVYGSRWGISFVIAVVLLIVAYFVIFKTGKGYKVRMVGQNINFASYGGIRSDKVIITTLTTGAAIAGLAGCMEVLGNYHRIMTGFSSGLGFDGLSVAMLGMSHPAGVFIVSILLAGIRQGAQLGLQISLSVPRELGAVLIALVILFVAISDVYRPALERLLTRKERKNRRKEG